MSQVLDTKVVEMQFDNSKFEKNIETSLNSLKKLTTTIGEAGKDRSSLENLAKAGDRVGVSFDNMNMKSRIGINMMDMLAGVGTKAFNRISDAVAGFALNMANSLSGMQAMRDGFNEYELKMGSVQTILTGAKIIDPKTGKNLEDDAKRLDIVNKKLEELNAYSDKTIYSFKDMTSNIGKFTNAGVNLDDSVAAIQGVANVAAASGANASEASRAMYNFSQALSSGAVKLIDWKSIENANMATMGFKQQLLDTAVALGTVEKHGKKYVSTTTDLQGKVSDAFNATKGFNDSLSHQWMTTEVLTQTLKNYSTDVREMNDEQLVAYKNQLKSIGYTDKQVEGIVKLSQKAFDAATEVKTFSQMMDTLKESLGSGWAQTWEIIFGDFNEAKKLWTGLNNVIDGMLSPIGKTRNAILQLWKADGGRDAMIKSFSNLWQAVQNLIAPLKDLWKAFTPNIEHSGKMLATITKGVEKLTAVVAKAAGVIGKALAFLLKPVIFFGNFVGKGLVKFVGIIQLAFSKIVNFFKPVGTAISTFSKSISEVFNQKITSKIKAFYTSIKETFENLKKQVGENAAVQKLIVAFKSFRDILEDLFGRMQRNAAIFASSFVAYLRRIWRAIQPLLSSTFGKLIKSLSNILLPKLERALAWITNKLTAFGKAFGSIDIKNSKLYKGIEAFPNKISGLANNKTLKSIATEIKNFGSEAIAFLSGKFEKLKTNLDAIKMPTGLKDVFENTKNFIKGVFGEDSIRDDFSRAIEDTAASTEKIAGENSGEKLSKFQSFLKSIADAFDWLKIAAGKAKTAIEDFIKFIINNTPKALKSLHTFFAGEDGILTVEDISHIVYDAADALSYLMTAFGVKELADSAGGIKASIGDIAEAINILCKRVGNKMRMEALKDFAIALGIVAGALFVLAMVPTDRLLYAAIVLVGLAKALTYFFDTISSANADLTKTAGNLSLAALVLSIGASMIAVAASIGILVGALMIFPKVIKAYNKLGDEFRTGMDRVKEVLAEIFEYLDHTVNARYGFRSAVALLALVASLSMIRKTIVKFANKETGDAMADGLSRIKEVLKLLGDFLASVSIMSVNFINIGVDFDTLGIAAIIWALGSMMTKITGPITILSKLTPSQFQMAFQSTGKILEQMAAFLIVVNGASTGMSILSKGKSGGLGEWIGLAANIAILASAISSVVASLKTITELVSGDEESFETALDALRQIFLMLGGVLLVVGLTKPQTAVGTLFGLSLAIGVLTVCVMMLVPIAHSDPASLISAVGALGGLMVSLGVALLLAGKAAGKATTKDIAMLAVMVVGMILLANVLRRLARTGDPDSLVGAGVAISMAALAIAGAFKILAGIEMISPMVILGLGALAAAIWGVAFAIKWFKQSSGEMVDASNTVSKATTEMTDSVEESTGNMAAFALDAMPPIIKELGASIGDGLKEAIGNFNLGETIRNMITTVKTDAKNWAQDFIDIGTNIMDGLSTALENPANIERIKSSMKALGQALLDAFKSFLGINSPSTVMIEQGGYIIDGLVQGLMQYPAKLAEWVTGIGTFIKDGITGFFGGAVEKGKELVDNIGTGIQNGKDFVVKKAGELGQAALSTVGKAKEWATKAHQSATSFGNKLRQSKNPIKSAAGSMIVGATTVVGGLGKSFKTVASAASSTFSSEINKGSKPAKAAAKAIVAGAKSAFDGLTNAFKSIGNDAAQGFRNGIRSMVSKVAEEAANMVRRAKQAAKNEQHSNSPSKDFMEFGGWAAQGYAIGMTSRKNTSLVERSAQQMVNTAKNAASTARFGSSLYLDSNPAISSMAYAMSQISDSLDESMDANPTIRPVIDMSDVNHNAAAISGLFGSKQLQASLDATGHIQSSFDKTMANRNAAMSMKSIEKLATRLNSMTESMNSRSLNIYNTIDGASDPSAFADELIRSFRLNARTI